jgi:exonuclease SbcD
LSASEAGSDWLADAIVPLRDRDGKVAALVAAIPFLRSDDLPRVMDDEGDAFIEGTRRVHARTIAGARQQANPDQAIVVMSHCYLSGTQLSELSERKILGGNLHALPADLFGEEPTYVALGHLHKAQQVGTRANVRYSGSPIPLSMAEKDYRHQVQLVELEGATLRDVRALETPRTVPFLRIPENGTLPFDEMMQALSHITACESKSSLAPFLEIEVSLDQPRPDLRASVDMALADKHVRLVRLGVAHTGKGAALGDQEQRQLGQLEPEEVFRLIWKKQFDTDPDESLLTVFRSLVEEARKEMES